MKIKNHLNTTLKKHSLVSLYIQILYEKLTNCQQNRSIINNFRFLKEKRQRECIGVFVYYQNFLVCCLQYFLCYYLNYKYIQLKKKKHRIVLFKDTLSKQPSKHLQLLKCSNIFNNMKAKSPFGLFSRMCLCICLYSYNFRFRFNAFKLFLLAFKYFIASTATITAVCCCCFNRPIKYFIVVNYFS